MSSSLTRANRIFTGPGCIELAHSFSVSNQGVPGVAGVSGFGANLKTLAEFDGTSGWDFQNGTAGLCLEIKSTILDCE